MKLDKRRKYYLILDTETATLPFVEEISETARKNVAITKPLVYDIGWQIIDRTGKVYKKVNYLITETFSVPSVFNTAYFKNKRPQYLEMVKNGEIELVNWNTAINELITDLDVVDSVGAYNAMFDFKKAIPFTELYIQYLYSNEYNEWELIQKKHCKALAEGDRSKPNKYFDGEHFRLRGKDYDMFDIWALACEDLLNNNGYKQFCLDNDLLTASKKYFSTSAETCYRFLWGNPDFEESHTALDDAIIESEIMTLIMAKRKNKFNRGLTYFPFRILGTVDNYDLVESN